MEANELYNLRELLSYESSRDVGLEMLKGLELTDFEVVELVLGGKWSSNSTLNDNIAKPSCKITWSNFYFKHYNNMLIKLYTYDNHKTINLSYKNTYLYSRNSSRFQFNLNSPIEVEVKRLAKQLRRLI